MRQGMSAEEKVESRADASSGRWTLSGVLLAVTPMLIATVASRGEYPPLTVSGDRASLVFSEYLMHFGNDPVPQQPEINATFLFRNVGNSPVEITDMQPSCGCLKPRISSHSVAPGESGRLTLPVKTATEAPGFHEYTVTVHFNDPKPRATTLTLKLVLPKKTIQIEPKALYVIGQSSHTVEHNVVVSDLTEAPFRVEEVMSSTPLFTPRVIDRQRDENGSRTTIGITISEKLPRGIQRGIVQVTTTDEATPYLHIPVLARGPDRDADELVAVQPEHFRLPAMKNMSVAATVECTLPKAWKISHIDTFPLELDVEFENVEIARDDLQQLRLKLTFSQLPLARIEDGVVTVHANDGNDMVTIPVQIVWP
ncbi:MAG: DUF1573 domain-containing protein [Planctomycetaceae bacterium]